MLNEFVYHGKSKLKCGFTTGTCAAAAAKAAVEMLLSGDKITNTKLVAPKGTELILPITNTEIAKQYVLCGVIKDSGDDPDITNGILICCTAEKIKYDIEIKGGEGIGIVTKAGLDQPVGEWAINSVPRKMIRSAVSEICEKYDYYGGIRITVSAPDGKNIAGRTYNPRMGIKGGISIIGTTGIIEPMSNSAIIETIRTEQKIRKAEGRKNLLLTIGNYSEDYLVKILPFMNSQSVICSNFIGEAIDIALELGFDSVLILGHIGKLVKLGAGIMNTHSAQADGRMDVLVTCGVLADTGIKTLKKIPECAAADAALGLLESDGVLEKTMEILMRRIQYYLDAKAKGDILIGAMTFSYKFGILGKTNSADEIISRLTEEYNG
ncbi:MAG: cobalt-precorrin-5B (C(1))-methyltransferase CbiD [Clostridium sp.]|nr:cobalt-precorrin-5B (C(1))-methyltransferase CbiD [Clostridium sp.]MCM1547002.1 cobalt-precorrin-5B (C(1))-methyltransferase CbiD [Ruminococcus sp.]